MRYSIIFICLLALIACKKKKTNEGAIPDELKNGLLVLNEGLFQHNNSSLSWVNLADESINNTFFEQKTNRGLGDTGNDMGRYGGKIYIVVNVSSTVEVLHATTGKSIRQISMFNGSTAKQPRSIAFHGNKAFITCFDGYVDVLDTTTLNIVTRIPVGSNPDQLTVANNKIYVTNSGGLNAVMDSTVSVIDPSSLTEISKITVGLNPGSIASDSNGEVYVISRGNYSSIPSRMHRIDSQTDTKVQSFNFNASSISPMGNQLLISYAATGSGTSEIALFDATTESIVTNQFINTSSILTLYGVSYSSTSNLIYIFDANNYTTTGYINLFQANGQFIKRYQLGLNPSKVLIYD